MRDLSQSYRFWLEHFIDGPTQVFPANESLVWSWEADNPLNIKRRKLATKLVFRNDEANGNYCYDIFKFHEDNFPTFAKNLLIQKWCDGIWHNYWTGQMRPLFNAYDADHCTVEVELFQNDKIACLIDTNPVLNLVHYNENIAAFIEGGYQFANCETTHNVDISDRDKVILIPDYICPALVGQPHWKIYQKIVTDGILKMVYVRRSTSAAPQDPALWTEVTPGHWVADAEMAPNGVWEFDTQTTSRGSGQSWRYVTAHIESYALLFSGFFKRIIDRQGNREGAIPNGVTLGGVLDAIKNTVSQFCGAIEIESAFFEYNDGGITRPTNVAYTKMADLLSKGNVTFFDITNVASASLIYSRDERLSPRTFTPATQTRISVVDFLASLMTAFNLTFWFDEGTDTLRIEHVSYDVLQRRMDLTRPAVREYIKGFHAYEYDTPAVPRTESFMWGEKSNTNETEMTISYWPQVSTKNEKKIIAPHFYIDLRYLALLPDTFSDSTVDDRPLMMMLCKPDGMIVESSDNPYPNGLLAFGHLTDIHLWRRPFIQGEIRYRGVNTSYRNFYSEIRTKKQVSLTIPICCDDVLNFYPDILVKTQLGWGEIAAVQITDPPQEMTLELLHDRIPQAFVTQTT